jgi:hypothetical protein
MFKESCVNIIFVQKIEIPVLVIAFNRPNHTRNLLQRLVSLGVRRVFVSIDGPRNKEEASKCEDVFSIAKAFSELMEITVLNRGHNLGCGIGVTAAIDWFFTHVEFGIVLEDDCLPADGFFEYFGDFFSKIEDYESQGIPMASAHNPFSTYGGDVISSYFLIQGWGTTRANWENVRRGFFKHRLPRFTNASNESRTLSEGVYWWANATRARLGSVDTWDSMFCDRMWALGRKCLIPANNLIYNNGFGEDATHTKDPNGSILVELDNEIISSTAYDQLLKHYYFRIRPRHAFTPFLKVIKDYTTFLFQARIEDSLKQDLTLRTETQFY